MSSDPDHVDRINSYALVAYLPDALSGFLDQLRRELVPSCAARVHVSILPPRPLGSPVNLAMDQVGKLAKNFPPFNVCLGDVEVFPISDVIYLSINLGRQRFREMHEAFDAGGLRYNEAFPYHPHVTIAQYLESDQLDELSRVARERWRSAALDRHFRVDTITFVQNTRRNLWIDLAQFSLGSSS